jgi:imidazoleglycerol-phosphate dehydratase
MAGGILRRGKSNGRWYHAVLNPLLLDSLTAMRQAEISRNTLETEITVASISMAAAQSKLATGSGFLDHMLDQIARHGMIDLDGRGQGRPAHRRPSHGRGCRHHARPGLAKAVGDKKGLRRYGHAYVPLDEALSRVVVDLSGRPGLVFNVPSRGP